MRGLAEKATATCNTRSVSIPAVGDGGHDKVVVVNQTESFILVRFEALRKKHPIPLDIEGE